MKETKFTPGPWGLEGWPEDDGCQRGRRNEQ